MDDIIETIYKRFRELIVLLDKQNEVSLRSDVDDYYKKILILAIGSYFESKISEILVNFIVVKSGNNDLAVSFVKSQAITRKYFTYFNWKEEKANSFFSMFGGNFKENAVNDVKNTPDLDEAIKAFIEINNDRNLLIHNNMGVYPIGKTADEVIEKYRKSLKFIKYITDKLS